MRDLVRREVATVSPFDEIEQAHQSAVLAWIDSGAPICRTEKPAIPPEHLVSYFVLVDAHDILLVDHRNAQLWLPTGGHVEPGEHPRATVVREAEEELGILVAEPQDPPLMITRSETVGHTAGHVDVSLWYVIQADRSAEIVFDRKEFIDVRWFCADDIPIERADPHMERFMAKLASF